MALLKRGLLAAAGLLLAASAAAETTTMRVNIGIPKDSHQGVMIDVFADEVAKRSGGRYKVETFYSGALGAERESVEAVQMGAQELTLTSTGPIPNFVPEVRILDVLFLFRDYDHVRSVLDGPVGQEMLQRFEPKGFKALAWGDNGFRHVTNSRRPVHSPQDLQGLKVRTMENPVHMEGFKAFGAMPTPMAFTELYTALQQNAVDGQENSLSLIMSTKIDQVQKHMTLTRHVFSPLVMLMNKDLFDSLPPEDQQIFIEAARAGARANRQRIDADEKMAVEALRKNGMEIVEDVDLAPFQAALAPVYERQAEQFGRENLERIRNHP